MFGTIEVRVLADPEEATHVVRIQRRLNGGDWVTVRIGNQSLVVLKSDSGLKAFHNTCRHRGSILCEKERGRFTRERIVCPYHAWTYDLDGRLVGTPRRMETSDFDATQFSLFEVALRT